MTRVLLHALRLFEGPRKVAAGNYYHMQHLLGALVSAVARSPVELKVLVDEEAFEPLRSVVPDRCLVKCVGSRATIFSADKAVIQAVAKYRPDIYHRPTGQLPMVRLPCKTIAGVADLNFRWLKTPIVQRVYKELSYRWTFKVADRVVCVSRFTARDVQSKFGVPESILEVIHHGVTLNANRPLAEVEGLGGAFWVTFGHQKHKNVETCLRVLGRLKRLGIPSPILAVVGNSSHVDEVLKPLAEELKVADRVRFLGRVSDAQVNWLYTHAEGLLFLSRFEGFGLPVIEAMGAGCPVICSDACSLPEVAGDAAIIVGVEDVDGVIAAMNQVRQRRQALVAAGRARAAAFSWEIAAQRTLELYRSLLSPPSPPPVNSLSGRAAEPDRVIRI